jgi:transposase
VRSNARGSFTRDIFNEFLDHILRVGKLCIVMDNASIHEPNLPDLLGRADLTIRFPLPYNPILNPIEKVIRDVKRLTRTFFPTSIRPDVIAIHSLARGEKTSARHALLRWHWTHHGRTDRTVRCPSVLLPGACREDDDISGVGFRRKPSFQNGLCIDQLGWD